MATAAKTQIKPQKIMTLTGNEAVAWAARIARVPVTFLFPIGPSDEVGGTMGQFYASGELKGKLMELEGEDATTAALANVANHGVRTLFCTNSQGIKKAWPCLASMGRIPVVIPDPHRLMFGGTVSPDWMDSIVLRDVAWVLLSAESSQECFDLMLQAYKIAEDPKVHLPIMVSYEGFETSHSDERVLVPDQTDVDKFLPAYRGPNAFATQTDWRENARIRRGRSAAQVEDTHPEIRYHYYQSMGTAKKMFDEVDKEYGDMFGRYWGGVLDTTDCQNAEVVMVTMCGLVGTAKIAAEIARDRGINAGVLKLRMYNPFPYAEIADALKTAKVVIALDRDEVGLLYHGIRSAMFGLGRQPKVLGRIAGLSGVSVTIEEALSFIEEGAQALKGKKVTELGWYLKGSRETHGVFANPW